MMNTAVAGKRREDGLEKEPSLQSASTVMPKIRRTAVMQSVHDVGSALCYLSLGSGTSTPAGDRRSRTRNPKPYNPPSTSSSHPGALPSPAYPECPIVSPSCPPPPSSHPPLHPHPFKAPGSQPLTGLLLFAPELFPVEMPPSCPQH